MKKDSEFWRGTVRDFWKTGKAGFALFLISLFVSIYGYIALDYEIVKGWKGRQLPKPKDLGLCEAHAKRPLHKLNGFLQEYIAVSWRGS